MNLMSPLTICDRLYLSEIVYGKIVRGYTPIDQKVLSKLINAVHDYAGFHIVITASDEQLAHQYKQRGDDLFPLEVIQKANNRFLEMIASPLDYFGMHDNVVHYHVGLNAKMPASDDKFLYDIRRMWFARCAWNMAGIWK